jgi:hypothetical protein
LVYPAHREDLLPLLTFSRNLARSRTSALRAARRMSLALCLPWSRSETLKDKVMWSWISCYLTGHDYGVYCEQGVIYLRCAICGRRSHGWDVRTAQADAHAHVHQPAAR